MRDEFEAWATEQGHFKPASAMSRDFYEGLWDAYAAGQRAALPQKPSSRDIVLMAGAILGQPYGTADNRHPWWTLAVLHAERAYATLHKLRNCKDAAIRKDQP